MKHRKIGLILAVGQWVLAALFAALAIHFGLVTQKASALEADLGVQLCESETHFRILLDDLRRTAPAIRIFGQNFNTAFENEGRLGDSIIKGAADIERFADSMLDSPRSQVAGRTGRLLLEERPVRRTMLLLAAICAGLAGIFAINGGLLFRSLRPDTPAQGQ